MQFDPTHYLMSVMSDIKTDMLYKAQLEREFMTMNNGIIVSMKESSQNSKLPV